MKQWYFSNSPNDVMQVMSSHIEGGWLQLTNPSDEEILEVVSHYELDEDMVRDVLDPNESPRFDRYDGKNYVYARYSLPDDQRQTTSPVLIVLTPKGVVTVSPRVFSTVAEAVKTKKDYLTTKKMRLVLQILLEINNEYKRRLNRVSKSIWEIRSQLDRQHIENKDFVAFIDIEEDLTDILSALEPMESILNALLGGRGVRLYEEDKDIIEDLNLATNELISLSNSRLKTIKNIREAYSTITANNLNKVFKLMTSITILMSIFTLITGVYSMNIALPGRDSPQAFTIITIVTMSIIVGVAIFFRRKKWL
jgi:magnesium transporter